MERQAWLDNTHRLAEELIATPGFFDRMEPYLREDQRGKWGLDNISGYYWYLHALVTVSKPKTVVELGRCLGTSALFMLGALSQDARLITVDWEERSHDLSHVLEDPRLTVITGNDLELRIYDDHALGSIDFLFVDTDHTCAQATKEWDLYRPLLSQGALVAFDDITMNDMQGFWHPLEVAKIATGGKYHYTDFGIVAP